MPSVHDKYIAIYLVFHIWSFPEHPAKRCPTTLVYRTFLDSQRVLPEILIHQPRPRGFSLLKEGRVLCGEERCVTTVKRLRRRLVAPIKGKLFVIFSLKMYKIQGLSRNSLGCLLKQLENSPLFATRPMSDSVGRLLLVDFTLIENSGSK